MTLSEKLAQLRAGLEPIDDPHERLAALVDPMRPQTMLHPGERIDAHRVRGCIAPVWIAAEFRDGHCHFRCDAESPLVRGLVALLCEHFSGASPAEIASDRTNPLEELGVTRNLSPTRRNGLASALAAIRARAEAVRNP